ncbi:MAG: putative PEP-binding protein [Acidimicrobiia bacterium]
MAAEFPESYRAFSEIASRLEEHYREMQDMEFAIVDGVGELMRIAIEKGRSTRPGLNAGICGERGGDPESIALSRRLGLDYVSCSPPRVPVARLAAAQAVIHEPSRQRS